MKAIIFGVNSQDGFYLSELLKIKNVEVIGVSRSEGNWLKGNITNITFVSELIRTNKPDYIFHLAANSTAAHSALLENHSTISTGAINILESVRIDSPKSKVFISGSALQFRNEGAPINEGTPFDPGSPYAIERIYTTHLSRYYRKAFNLSVYNGFFFNHDSPQRTERHINQKIALAAKRIRTGSSERLTVGNVDVKKEFNFAGDIMEAVWILMNQSIVYEAVIGSGLDYTIRDWLECCFKHIGKNWMDHVDIRDDYVPDYQRLVSDPFIIKSLGWNPKTKIDQLASLMMS